jgi:PAS domain S-box-containing protein
MLTTAPIITGGHVAGVVASWRDVTEQMRAERDRNTLVEILEATPDVVCTARLDGQVLYANRAARAILGIPPDADLEGFTIFQGYPEWAYDFVHNEGIPTALQEGQWLGETAMLREDGREIPMSQLILAHKGPGGAVEMLSTIARDVSEQKALAALLARVPNWRPSCDRCRRAC